MSAHIIPFSRCILIACANIGDHSKLLMVLKVPPYLSLPFQFFSFTPATLFLVGFFFFHLLFFVLPPRETRGKFFILIRVFGTRKDILPVIWPTWSEGARTCFHECSSSMGRRIHQEKALVTDGSEIIQMTLQFTTHELNHWSGSSDGAGGDKEAKLFSQR